MSYELGRQSVPPPTEVPLDCGAFWPAVLVLPFYGSYRIPAEIPAAQIREHLLLAAGRVMDSLEAFETSALADGYATLADVPAREIDGQSHKVRLFMRAVYCEAKAEILKETQSVDRTAKAENVAKSAEETEDKYREFAAAAIRQLASYNRLEVDLL